MSRHPQDSTTASNAGRATCLRCQRPASVCLCPLLPQGPLATRTRVIILQHPHESKKRLATVPVLRLCLASCRVLIGRRFTAEISPALLSLLEPVCGSRDELHFGSIQPTAEGKEPPAVAAAAAAAATGAAGAARAGRGGGGGRGVDGADGGICKCGHVRLLLFPGEEAEELDSWAVGFCKTQLERRERGGGRVAAAPAEASLSAAPAAVGAVDFQAPMADAAVKGASVVMKCREGGGIASGMACGEGHGVTLIVIDGTWQQAKEMFRGSSGLLLQYAHQVCLPFDTASSGAPPGHASLILRKEPSKGFVSTMEAVARALGHIEPRAIGIVESRGLERIEPRATGNVESRGLGSLEPRSLKAIGSMGLGTAESSDVGDVESREIGAVELRTIGGIESRDLGTLEPRDLGKKEPSILGTSSRDVGVVEAISFRDLGTIQPHFGFSSGQFGRLGSSDCGVLGCDFFGDLSGAQGREGEEMGEGASGDARSGVSRSGEEVQEAVLRVLKGMVRIQEERKKERGREK